MEIKRDVYLDRLIVRKHNGFIKVITGIRRSGKSYLLNTLFYNHLIEEGITDSHIIKFAFDSADATCLQLTGGGQNNYKQNLTSQNSGAQEK